MATRKDLFSAVAAKAAEYEQHTQKIQDMIQPTLNRIKDTIASGDFVLYPAGSSIPYDPQESFILTGFSVVIPDCGDGYEWTPELAKLLAVYMKDPDIYIITSHRHMATNDPNIQFIGEFRF